MAATVLTSRDRVWTPIEANSDQTVNEQSVAKANQARDAFVSELRSVVTNRHLVVLAGLGTTLYLNSTEHRVAPTMADLWSTISDFADFDEVLEIVRHDPTSNDVEELLSRCQTYLLLNSEDDTVRQFVADSEQTVVTNCRFVGPETDLRVHEDFLRRLARRSAKLDRLSVFTTNYDLCFETAASRASFICVDGFSHSSQQRFDGTLFSYDFVRRGEEIGSTDFVPNVFRLHKLHGSVDWQRSGPDVIRRASAEEPLIIYPRSTKFESSYKQPFFDLMSRFQHEIRQPDTTILVLGSGLQDNHVAEPVWSAVRSNTSLRLVIVGPELQNTASSMVNSARSLVENGDSRILMLESTFEYFVPLIPDLVQTTEQEQHERRLAQLDQA